MLSPSTDKLKTGLTAFEASNAAKMGLLNYAGGAKVVPGWYMTGMKSVGVGGAAASGAISLYQLHSGEISQAEATYDVVMTGISQLGWKGQLFYWSGQAGKHYGPSTWGWDIFGPESYYGRLKYWIHH